MPDHQHSKTYIGLAQKNKIRLTSNLRSRCRHARGSIHAPVTKNANIFHYFPGAPFEGFYRLAALQHLLFLFFLRFFAARVAAFATFRGGQPAIVRVQVQSQP